MKNSIEYITLIIQNALIHLYGINESNLEIQYTKKEFQGDVTFIIFLLSKKLQKSLEDLGQEIGQYIEKNTNNILSFNLIRGFLNFQWKDSYYIQLFNNIIQNEDFQLKKKYHSKIMIEYSSPNTNKPLHLGHIRNILLGHSISMLFKSIGEKVIKIQIINDRGIHICKSIVGWKKFGGKQTPQNTGIKGDHFVGKYYTIFEKYSREEIQNLCNKGYGKKQAEQKSSLMQSARKTLQQWESGDPNIINIWKKMNQWVYDGFSKTYYNLGVNFDVEQFESQTYLFGKKIVKEGLEKGIFYQKEDGSIWINLDSEGLDEKLLLRSDGTSVYITQDLGTVVERFKKYSIDILIYIVGEEQNYYFKVLFLILKKLGYSWAEKLYHLSYGMVNLPTGKMKSREGTTVDADNLIKEMHFTARKITEELGKLGNYSEIEKEELFEIIGQGALKYYILKIDPKKHIIFNPVESIDFKGNTGPYIQYTYARICSLSRKAFLIKKLKFENIILLNKYERNIIKLLEQYPIIIENAVKNLNPSLIANYVYDLSKIFNDFYQNINILNNEDINQNNFRIKLSIFTGKILKKSMNILGIKMPERM